MEGNMQSVGVGMGVAVLAALGVWWIALWVRGIRTPPSGNDPDQFNRNI